MGKSKYYFGNRPDPSEGWCLMDRVMDGWELYTRYDDGWIRCKVVATRPVDLKANYWWSFHHDTGVLRLPRDFAIMRDTRPDLHAAVCAELEEVYGWVGLLPVRKELP